MNKLIDIDEESGLARIQAGRSGPRPRGAAGRAGLDVWATSPTASPTARLAAGSRPAHRACSRTSTATSPTSRAACGWCMPGKVLAVRPLPQHLDRPERPRDGPRLRRSARRHHRGRPCRCTGSPKSGSILGYLFPTWEAGLAAMQEISTSDAHPSVTRVSDAKETAFSFATRKKSSGISISSLISKGLMKVLKRRGWDLDEVCLSFIGYEGGKPHVARQKKIVKDIVGKHGGIVVGKGPGVLYDQKKFDTPYIRDFLLDRGAVGDVSETAAPWSKLLPLYNNVDARPRRRTTQLGVHGLDHVPPVALLPLRRVPVLHLRLQARRRRPACSVRRGQERHPAGIRRLRRHPVAPPRRRDRARRRGWSRTSPLPAYT